MTGAAITIEDASAADTIQSVKRRVFVVNRQLPVGRQRLMYRPGPRGIQPLADDETLGGAGVEQDGTAELDVLILPLTEEESSDLGRKVFAHSCCGKPSFNFSGRTVISFLGHLQPILCFVPLRWIYYI